MGEPLDLGCFSVSLHVADLEASLEFYGHLGFEVLGGEDRWRILGNGSTRLGLFEDLDDNILTFNPGLAQDWPDQPGVDRAAGPGGEPGRPEPLADFTDVREIERRLDQAGVEMMRRTETPDGPDFVVVTDPDGNRILIDQFY